jgi:RNA polymerase sigma-70 factor, ECF subfamily
LSTWSRVLKLTPDDSTLDPPAAAPVADPDRDLLARCRAELPYNTTSFAELVRRHESAVFQLCRQYLENDADAEEVVQDTFLKVFRYITRFEGRSTFRTWVYRIATNECATRYRRRIRRQQARDAFVDEARNQPVATDPPEIPAEDPYRFEGRVGRAMDVLSEPDREILVLRHIGELPIQEVADALGIGLSAAKMRLYRAEERFQNVYRGIPPHPPVT